MSGDADALQSLPGITTQLLDWSRLTLSLFDPARGLFEDLGDFDFVLDCGKASSEPRQKIAQCLEKAFIERLAVLVEQPVLSQALHTIPLLELGGAFVPAGQGDDASVGPPEEKRTALSGFGPDPRSIGLERAIARRRIQ